MFWHCLPLLSCIRMPRLVPRSLVTSVSSCIPAALALSQELARLVLTSGHLHLLYPVASDLFPDLPMADSIVSFRSQFSCCPFTEIAPTIISPFSLIYFIPSLSGISLFFCILSPILEVKLWEDGDLVCPFHCKVGAQRMLVE